MLSTWTVQLVEVPPSNPKKTSLVVPAHAEMSSRRLAETPLVGTYFAWSEKRVFVPMPHTITSSTGSPATVKSKAIATALLATARGNQAIGTEPPPPSRGRGEGPGDCGPELAVGLVWNVSRNTAESRKFTTVCPP